MHGRVRWLGTGLALVAIGCALILSGPPAHAQDAAGEVRAALTRWMEAFNAGDADQLCDLFAPDLIATYQGAPDRDHATVCRQLRAAVANPEVELRYDLEVEEIMVEGDLAVARVTWTLTSKHGAGAEETQTERGIDVFRRQPDGSWKIARFIAFTADP